MKVNQNTYQFQWGERCSMLIIQSWVNYYGPYWFGLPKQVDYVAVSENRYNETFASLKMLAEWRKLGTVILKAAKRREYLKLSLRVRGEFDAWLKKFNQQDVAKLSGKKLFAEVNTFYNYISSVGIFFNISQAASSDIILDRLSELLKREGLAGKLSLLITQSIPDILLREQRDLARLGKKKTVSDNDLYRHAIKYSLLFYNSYNLSENLSFLRGRLSDSFDYERRLVEMKQLRREQENIFKTIKNKEIKDICLFFQKFGVDRLELKNSWAGAEFRFLSLFKEVARRAYVPLPAMMASFTLEDYQQALVNNKSFSVDQMTKRIQRFVWWKKGQRVRLLEKPAEVEPFFVLKQAEKNVKTSGVIGTSANKGKAKGVVRIVKSLDIASVIKDLERFQRGDILVTWMTQPNMVPIAAKAGAIVADEGGITSHAAVIAREFGVPCIVGAKIATKVFKDGDVVEVDGDSGIVRMIKQK